MAKRATFARVLLGLAAAAAFGTASCGSDKPPAKTAAQCTKMGAKTGVAGAKTGVKTGVAGVKQFGKAVGGLAEGGSDEARQRWREGKAETKQTAHAGAEETRQEAHSPDCP
jgi:hypothetical protein